MLNEKLFLFEIIRIYFQFVIVYMGLSL
uniref:Photosystem II protein K n=1 Tax=Alisma plantago-aquatica TaxID=15000 RepID=A0A513U1P5_ALIPL|nr:photosystem II protein K [Alisma plantago-aquatica]YP_010998880.1 photosystem II protein K [Alisma subcordatum]YP_010998965.1 photosystem II protein K [Alisma triviale]WNS59280.1 photosystem II protein K [Alisma plantago-aquatica subsp. orientale]QDG01546.1 photosystem II protein K [Alisma plantago-aquatica]WPM91540.1 photosystem II protein K [Alisma plantago-aquatica subsp. orientale]WPM91624.1 photosystem II protein K [Alisma subcordatum]WPM91709.1 photosystem II protein K [Alisma trivi